MNRFILKGNLCYSISKIELKTLSGYVVCKDGKCAGVFEEIPDEYKDRSEAFIYHLIYVAELKKYIQGNRII